MRKAINIFQYTTIAIGLIVIIIFLIPRFIGIRPYIVLSGSMEDTIKTGAVAYVNSNVKAEEIEVGDIIAFNTGTKQVTHRVVSINSDNSFTTKGDANNVVDINSVKFSNYLGKTIFSIPYLGYLLSAFQTKLGYAILIALVGINIITLIFFNENEEPTKKDKNNNKKNILSKENN